MTIAGFITNSTTFIVMYIMLKCQKDLKEANTPFGKKSFEDLGSYISIGVPNIVAQVVASFALEEMTLAAGLLSVTD